MEKLETRKDVRLAGVTVICILISFLGLWLARRFQLPFWLDTVGLCLAAYYTASLPMTLLTALVTGIIMVTHMELPLVFLLGNLAVAAVMYAFVHVGYLKKLQTAMMSSFAVGAAAVVVFTPLVMKWNDGVTMNLWGDALVDMLRFYQAPEPLCVLAGVAVVDILDKQLCFLLAVLLIRGLGLLRRRWKPQARQAAVSVLLLTLLSSLTVPALAAPQEQERSFSSLSDYVQTIYDQTNGLPSTAVNAVAHTPDGSIWVGGYAGLCLYDGTEFHYITEGKIANVTALLTDRQGRLWVGTNDQGVAVLENGRFRFLNRENGLSDNSVRTIFQAKSGDLYVGSLGELCRVSEDLETITRLEKSITGVWSIAENSAGLMACVDYSGQMFLLQNDRLLAKWEPDPELGRYTCVLDDGDGFLLATSDNHLLRFSSRGAPIDNRDEVYISDLQFINRLKWDSKGNLWICAYNGAGYRTPSGELVMLRFPNFNKSIGDVIEDYEGNYWLTSSSDGLMKLCRSPFSDIHSFVGLEPESVNAVASFRGTMYCGTDSGLTVVDPDGKPTQNAVSQAVGTHRVRCVQVDSRDRLWVCTYGGGLLCWEGGDTPVRRYTQAQDGAAGDYFRCLQELPDGTMAAGGSEGLTFIKNGAVTGIITEKNGLEMTQILCMTLDDQGTLYAGSDGSGIYVVRDGKVIDILNEDNGLSSRVILRMIPYQEGCFVVTSNSLNYMEDNHARVLENFPYFNNFDIVLHGSEAWVLASCGIIVVELEDLLRDEAPLSYRLYNYKNGLQGSLTANAWVYVDDYGQLYLCSNIGVQRINMHQPLSMRDDYKMDFGRFTADGQTVVPMEGAYHIGAGVDRIEIGAAVFNYDQIDLRVRFYLEGVDKNPAIIRQSDLRSISYSNIPHGSYTLKLQLLNSSLEVTQEISCPVIKEARMWENSYYHIYLLVVMTWLIVFGTWVVLSLRQISCRKRELEVMSQRLEEQVREQTSQIVEQADKLAAMQQHTIEGMATLIESRDGSTGAHVRNTGVYARMLAERMFLSGMYPEEIDETFVDMIGRMAPLHDVGKIKVSDMILNKPGRLTEEEYAVMKTHAAEGGEIIVQILGQQADPETVQMAHDLATYHHERWDGKGYPSGKSGTDIPLCARIMAVADVFDALSSKRIYKESMSLDDTFREMVRNEGSQFEADIVEVLVELREDLEEYLKEHPQR